MSHLLPPNLITRLLISAALCFAACSVAPKSTAADALIQAGTTISVTTTADELNIDGDCSLREALQAANLNIAVDKCPAGTGADSIVLKSGTYNLTRKGTDEDNGDTGDLDILDDVSIVGPSLLTTVIDGQASDRVFHVITEVSALFANLTIRNGAPPADSFYGGGGILNGSPGLLAGSVEIVNCHLMQNRVLNIGGGLGNAGLAILKDVTFSNNQAVSGGGIFNEGTLTIEGATIVQNTASFSGGGIDNNSGALLTNVTISGNVGPQGGGLFNDGTLTMLNLTFTDNSTAFYNNGQIGSKNTIFANSTSGDNCTGQGTFTSLGHNLDSGETCKLIGLNDLTNTDPLLGTLADNLGPTHTHALLLDSPAIDTGDNGDCPLYDQRGAYRLADGDDNGSGVCDIGAYEYAGTFPFNTYLPTLFRH